MSRQGPKPRAQSIRPSAASECYDLLRCFVHGVRGTEIQSAVLQHLLPLLDVRPFHANDNGHGHAEFRDRGNHAFGEDVAAQNAAIEMALTKSNPERTMAGPPAL